MPPRKVVKRGQLWGGNPAVHMRDLRPEDLARIPRAVAGYQAHAREHMASLADFNPAEALAAE